MVYNGKTGGQSMGCKDVTDGMAHDARIGNSRLEI